MKLLLEQGTSGLRLLRQEKIPCIFSFLCSQNNHQSRIGAMVKKLMLISSKDSQRVVPPTCAEDVLVSLGGNGISLGLKRGRGESSGAMWAPFPSAADIASVPEEVWRTAGFGYRAKFISAASKALATEQIGKWPLGEVASLRHKLIALDGVGRKVADCILLFAFDCDDLVPIDTHMLTVTINALKSNALWAKQVSFDERERETLLRINDAVAAGETFTLTSKVHDVFQALYRQALPDAAGWAHCFLFAKRIGK
jgi:3-methyladenine DNA glycosylase/8-oxoguanine DNA glycosylase